MLLFLGLAHPRLLSQTRTLPRPCELIQIDYCFRRFLLDAFLLRLQSWILFPQFSSVPLVPAVVYPLRGQQFVQL